MIDNNFILSLKNDKRLSNINNQSNLIIGLYEGLPVESKKGGLIIFLKSLRKYTECIVIIWCHKKKFIQEYKSIEEKYNCIFLLYDIFNDIHIQTRRLYLTKILFDIYTANIILFSDMNDVFFQNDPFNIPLSDKDFYCALEINHFSQNNRSLYYNKNWLNKLSIQKYEYENEFVICSGTIYGNYNAFKNYLEWIFNNRMSHYPLEHGIDQGFWMEYIYSIIKKDKCTLQHVNNSLILTGDNIKEFNVNENNKLINNNNIEYIIVHQFNRVNGLLKLVNELL